MIPVEFLLTAIELNDETRRGWETRGVEDAQDVAGHSWGVAFLTLLFSPRISEIDGDRAIKLALVHDLAESVTGDLVVNDPSSSLSQEEKHRREQNAMEDLADLAEGGSIHFDAVEDLWHEYENRDSIEARFVKDMDMVEVCLLALKYETNSRYDPDSLDPEENGLTVFFDKAEEIVNTDEAKELILELRRIYEKETKRE